MNDSWDINFTVLGEPVAKGRARFSGFRAYTPTKTVNYETLVKEMFYIKYPEHRLMTSHLEMSIFAYFSKPKSMSKKEVLLADSMEIRPRKIDCDNIAKIILDALNSIAYIDDRQVARLFVEKIFSDKPRVDICIRKI